MLIDEASPPNVTPTGNLVENNFIGIDAAGTKALTNDSGGRRRFRNG